MRALQLVSPGLFGSTRVAPGELLVGDIDGVVTIP